MPLDLQDLGRRAKAASVLLARVTTDQKNRALLAIADSLDARAESILAANRLDLENGRAAGLSAALLDRMSLEGGRLAAIAEDVRKVAALSDPVGAQFDARTLPNGLQASRRRTPIGVIGVIYEARPNVTVDVVALTLKSGNAVILRGGKEILGSNLAIVSAIRDGLNGLKQGGFEAVLLSDAIQVIDDPDRRYIDEMLRLHQYIDMIIPRGGAALHKLCRENSTIPVITGGIGVCHAYVDDTAKLDDALNIVFNGKTQRPSVCNTLDTLLVHDAVAAAFLPRVAERLGAANVLFKAEPKALALLSQTGARVEPAGPDDFDIEWMALILGVKVVSGLDEALDHIHRHSTGHSEVILTETPTHADRFVNEVDSSAVFVNASTRFNDGGQLGLGAEIAVSTQKLHARGPMALEELTTYKWVVIGSGHVRP
ncbi:MAG: glutamate-5-semialdehyde dehydrogenase [Anaerolineae bacterium]|nr:glutamate-5-semialdehyde dehydrogenase [Anaerolineae bacterium]NUQ06468.1 glutamate-5-semialdehyde dehydrogenase [Anaerolineae bacterium]